MTQGKLPEQEERIFLSLCGQYDRELLAGKIEMTLPEFERITYITMAFGYTSYTMELQERYIELTQKLNEQLDRENEILKDYPAYYQDEGILEQNQKWLDDFIQQAPADKRDFCREIIRKEQNIV